MKRLMISLMALGALVLAGPASAHGYAQHHHDKAPAKHARAHHHAAKTTKGRHGTRQAAKAHAKAVHHGAKTHAAKAHGAKHAAKNEAAKHSSKRHHTADRPVVIPPAHHRHY